MKINSFKKYIKLGCLSAFAAATLVSCDKRFEKINTDPNQSSITSTSFLLANAQREMMDNTWDEWFNGRRGNQLAQYWASNQYSNESRYQFRSSITNNYWGYYYARVLQDLQEIVSLNEASPNDYIGFGKTANQIAIAHILQTWMYQNITDCWGPIPYSQALKGSEFPQPQYDSQEDVYNGMIATLNTAINNIDLADNGIKGDIIYQGDMAKWKKFANSLKLRVAIRMSDVNSAAAGTAISEAVASGVFTSNADNAQLNYLTAAPNINPLAEDFKTRNDFAASNIMVDELTRLNDPRIGLYYSPTVETGTFIGEVYGLDEANAALTRNDSISQRNASVLASDAPGVFLDYAQVEFILAEAVERGYIGGSVATHYVNGITASMNWWNKGSISAADITTYIASPEVDYATLIAAGSTWKQIIGRQKWIALYMQGVQGWTEWRRLDFGILQLPADGVLDGSGVPTRMRYPLDEQTLNYDSYTTGVSMLGGADNQDTKLWWDVN